MSLNERTRRGPWYRSWKLYRMLLALVWVMPITAVFGADRLNAASVGYFHDTGPAVVVSFLWVTVWWLTAIWVMAWRCPRCGKVFAQKSSFAHKLIFAKRCVHCGLPKYENG